jgi:predicted nucleic acid-binding protein
MLVALDTNILAYAEGIGDALRCEQAIRLIEQLPENLVMLPAQTLGELFRVLTGKANREPGLSRMAIMAWADSFIIGDSSWSAFQAAMDLAVDHRFQVRDALIMAVTAENHCRLLLSEDLQNGFIWRGVTVVNPFASPTSPLLDNVLKIG